jgi:hypothetical protein
VIIFLIRFLKKYLKNRARPEEEKIIKDTRPAYVIALEKLAGIDFNTMLQQGNFVEFYYQLSQVLRFFLERQYNINALEMTTSEIRHNLDLPDPKEKNEVLDCLQRSDRVKFAKYIPESIAARELLSWLDTYLHSYASRSTEVTDA